MQSALNQAKDGRLHILEKMSEALSTPRSELSGNVPKLETIKINPSKIKDIIGSRGKVIKGLSEEHSVNIDINDDGTVKITGNKNENIQNTIKAIEEITFEPETGVIYEGTVIKIIDAGAFINFANNNRDGFIHISELADYRVEFVEDVINEGDFIKVKVIGFDKKGRPKLSYRCVNQETGEDISDQIIDKEDKTGSTPPPKKKRRGFFS